MADDRPGCARSARRQADPPHLAEDALARLNELSSRLWHARSLREGLDEMLAATIELLGADKGNVQLLDAERGVLRIAAQRGFEREFLEFFHEVATEDDSACGRALRSGERVVIEDVETDPPYAPFRSVARAAGYRAVQSTPLIGRDGTRLGMLSTHFGSVHVPREPGLRMLDLYVRQATDFIERCRIDEALRQSEERYRAIVESQAEMICRFRPDGTILFVNGAYARARGSDPAALLGRDFWNFIDPEDRRQVRMLLDRLRPDAPEVRIENRFATQAGMRWTLWINRGLSFDGRGRAEEVQSSGIDITERKQAEQALRESERRFRLMADAAPVLIWISGTDKLCSWFNKPWLDFVGRPMQRELGNGWVDNVHPDDLARCLDKYGTAFDRREAFTMEYRLRRHDGAWRWVLDNGIPLYRPGAEFTGYIGSCIDITRHKEAEDDLREVDRRKDQFLATLAHELRNPLAPIRNAVQVLRLAGDRREVAEHARQTLERQVQQMVRLVDDLLDVSRIARNRIELRRETVALASVVYSAVETSRPLIEAAGHDLTVSLARGDVWLHADTTRLAQVVGNLLNNAAKYTPAHGRIWIDAGQESADAVVRVRDTGLGISPEMLPHVFEMFTQGDASRECSQGGQGIGLTLVKSLVEMHGGSVEARSAGLGRGSEFVVRLPVASAGELPEPAGGKAITSQHAPRASRRILVVDDNRDSADSLGILLGQMGHEVRTAHDGNAALAVLDTFRPELALLDIGMPGMSGYELARRLRERPDLAGIVLVAVTGWGQDEDRRRSREAGFDHHLTKPADLALLETLLASLPETPAPTPPRG